MRGLVFVHASGANHQRGLYSLLLSWIPLIHTPYSTSENQELQLVFERCNAWEFVLNLAVHCSSAACELARRSLLRSCAVVLLWCALHQRFAAELIGSSGRERTCFCQLLGGVLVPAPACALTTVPGCLLLNRQMPTTHTTSPMVCSFAWCILTIRANEPRMRAGHGNLGSGEHEGPDPDYLNLVRKWSKSG